MTRMAGAVVGMAAVALGLAYLGFGWPILLVGGPLLVGITIAVVALVLFERPRAVQRERREAAATDSPWRAAAERGDEAGTGLMSGFFELSPQAGVVPEQRPASTPARPAGAV